MKLVMLQKAREYFIKKMENKLKLMMKDGNICKNLDYNMSEYVF